ncbi:MAG TPA: hypothetical protein EYP98_04160, partial [Planctomycetes bacterium]|nr:hypothetical protein [Planctomycetota bacterium]
MRRTAIVTLLAVAAVSLSSCGETASDGVTDPTVASAAHRGNANARIRVGFVTNCAVEFWAVAEVGAQAAA